MRPDIKRAFFILTAAAVVGSACEPRAQYTADKPSIPGPVRPAEVAAAQATNRTPIVGGVPGEYSTFIKEARLIPRVFSTESVQESIGMTLDYLRRYQDALSSRPELRGEPLSSFRINTPDNYPVTIPQDWTLWHVVDELLQEIDLGKTRIIYDGVAHLAGQRSRFAVENGVIERKSEITIGKAVIDPNRQFTEAELAYFLLHEHTHALQDERAFSTTVDRFPQSVRVEEQIKTHIHNMASEQNKQLGERLGVRGQFNEAQADVVGYFFIYLLNRLNNSKTFPGTSYIDPEPQYVAEVQKYDPSFINLYQFFVNSVIRNRNALDREWLVKNAKAHTG